jgi:hypothetical protein
MHAYYTSGRFAWQPPFRRSICQVKVGSNIFQISKDVFALLPALVFLCFRPPFWAN